MIDLEEIEKACREATPGPWRVKWAKHHETSHSEHWIVGADGAGLSIAYKRGQADGEIGQDRLDKDVMFAANARSWVPALVERVGELEAEVKRHELLGHGPVTVLPTPVPESEMVDILRRELERAHQEIARMKDDYRRWVRNRGEP